MLAVAAAVLAVVVAVGAGTTGAGVSLSMCAITGTVTRTWDPRVAGGLAAMAALALVLASTLAARNVLYRECRGKMGESARRTLLTLSSLLFLTESVTPFPGLGIQLATAHGLHLPNGKQVVFSVQRRFIALDDIETVVVHEGITRWSVRYYLGIVRTRGRPVVVAYDVSGGRGKVKGERAVRVLVLTRVRFRRSSRAWTSWCTYTTLFGKRCGTSMTMGG